jgi:hypothetical protein
MWHPLSAKVGTNFGRSVGIVRSPTKATEFGYGNLFEFTSPMAEEVEDN